VIHNILYHWTSYCNLEDLTQGFTDMHCLPILWPFKFKKANRRDPISHISSICILQLTGQSPSIISAFNSGFVPVFGFHICMTAHYNYRTLLILQV
jgi:hypothetical protein